MKNILFGMLIWLWDYTGITRYALPGCHVRGTVLIMKFCRETFNKATRWPLQVWIIKRDSVKDNGIKRGCNR